MSEEIENALHAAEAVVETLKAEVAAETSNVVAAPVAAEAAPPEESGSQYLGHIGEPRIEGKDY